MPDAIFAHPRIAAIYDLLDGDRDDLDAYDALVDELGARSVLDVGSGTGTFACRLAARGVTVVALEPAAASLAVARTKEHADRVTWVHGDDAALPPLAVDLVTMTGNVAQVFVTEQTWAAVLGGARRALRPGGRLVFETRDPARAAWSTWTEHATRRRVDLGAGSTLDTWVEVTAVELPLVSFRHTFVFSSDGETLTSDSTLRFLDLDDMRATLATAGFVVDEVRDAPDRPGLELVVIAQRLGGSVRA